jgi:hypothetical protein
VLLRETSAVEDAKATMMLAASEGIHDAFFNSDFSSFSVLRGERSVRVL